MNRATYAWYLYFSRFSDFCKTKLKSIFLFFYKSSSEFDHFLFEIDHFWDKTFLVIRDFGRAQISVAKVHFHCNIHVKFFGNRSNFEVLFMELIWHISGELIMYKILRGRWIWSVCFAPPFNVLLSKMRNGSEFVYSATLERIIFLSPFLLSSAGRTVVEDEHLAERTPKFNIYSRHT